MKRGYFLCNIFFEQMRLICNGLRYTERYITTCDHSKFNGARETYLNPLKFKKESHDELNQHAQF